jgi:hypothetical protein
LFFKKRFWINAQATPSDIIEFDLIFHQSIYNVLKGSWPTDPQTAIALGGLQFQYEFEKPQLMDIIEEKIEEYVPRKHFHLHSAREWVRIISDEAGQHQKKTKDQIQRMYMKIVKSLPLFGWTIFSVQQRSSWGGIPPAFDLAISELGVKFIKSETGEVLRQYKFDQVIRWEFTTSAITLQLAKLNEASFETSILLQSIQGYEVCSLLEKYVEILGEQSKFARAIRDSLVQGEKDSHMLQFKANDVIVIDQREGKWWQGHFLNDPTKKGLFAKEDIRILIEDPTKIPAEVPKPLPTPPVVQVTPPPQNVDQKPDRSGSVVEEPKKEKEVKPKRVDWNPIWLMFRTKKDEKTAFSATERMMYQFDPISLSLLPLDDQNNKLACTMFVNIMRFTGDYPPAGGAAPRGLPAAQDLIQTAIDNPIIQDEFYVQLCKQTTFNGNKQKAEKAWQLLAFGAGCFVCSEWLAPFVESHIRNYLLEDSIGPIAATALKRLKRSLESVVKRIHAPCILEMESIIHSTPFKYSIGLPEAMVLREPSNMIPIQVDSAMTIDQAIVKLTQQIGLKNDAGYGLFDVINKEEDAVLPIKGDYYLPVNFICLDFIWISFVF